MAPPPLQSLCLADNAMEDRGLAALAAAMRAHPAIATHLQELDVSSNGIGAQARGYHSTHPPGGGEGGNLTPR